MEVCTQATDGAGCYPKHCLPKLCFLVYLLFNICKRYGRKVLVFCDWPFGQWLIEIILQNLGFRTLVIRVKHKFAERAAVFEKFNRKESFVNVLIISTKFDNLKQNMQSDCTNVILINT